MASRRSSTGKSAKKKRTAKKRAAKPAKKAAAKSKRKKATEKRKKQILRFAQDDGEKQILRFAQDDGEKQILRFAQDDGEKQILRFAQDDGEKQILRFAQDDGKKQILRSLRSHQDDKKKKKPAFNAKTDSANDPNWQPPVWDDDVLLGAHVSIAGGTHNAPPRARAIGASAMQIFTKMANRWADRLCEGDECAAFIAALEATRVRATIAHDSYLINLASPDATLRRRSIESFVAELQRCEALGLTYLVSHPGNYIDDRASGIRRNADAITEALSRVPGRTILCMETTSGSGTAIGATFDDLAELIDAIPEPHRSRMGICLDTCHAYSAGYDLVNAYDDVWARFDDLLGMSRLKVMHLNDSKTPFNSKRDRHELIGEGSIGEKGFRQVMTDARLAAVPKVIETPKGTDPTATDARMLARLRSYLAGN